MQYKQSLTVNFRVLLAAITLFIEFKIGFE